MLFTAGLSEQKIKIRYYQNISTGLKLNEAQKKSNSLLTETYLKNLVHCDTQLGIIILDGIYYIYTLLLISIGRMLQNVSVPYMYHHKAEMGALRVNFKKRNGF